MVALTYGTATSASTAKKAAPAKAPRKNVFARLLAGNVPVELIKNTKVPVLLLPPDHKGNI